MTNNKINELLAVEVRNFSFRHRNDEIEDSLPYYWDLDKNEYACLVKDWSPTTDMNQAMECWNKMFEDGFYIDLLTTNCLPDGLEFLCKVSHIDGSIDEYEVYDKSAPLAICKAILKAKGVKYE